jgi:O-methyltransferase
MKLLKNAIKRLFLALGLRVVRDRGDYVRFENFRNLSRAYEHLFNEFRGGQALGQDEARPKLLARLIGTQPPEAYYIVESLAKTKSIDGDVCEFGVAEGETSALIANEIKGLKKTLHLFDSFEGLPNPSARDDLIDDFFSLGSIEAYAGTMSWPETKVISHLKAISFPSSQYSIHKGFIEDLILRDENFPAKVSFAYVDFDFYTPIKTALNYLHNVTLDGSIIIVDDYDFFSTGVKSAVDEFVEEKNSLGKVYEVEIPDKNFGHLAILHRQG